MKKQLRLRFGSKSQEDQLDNMDKILEYMSKTFAQQRFLITSTKDVEKILIEYPLFFKREPFLQHFQILQGTSLSDFSNIYNQRSEGIYKFFKSLQIGKNGKAKKTASDVILNSEYNLRTSISLIVQHFKENAEFVLQIIEVILLFFFSFPIRL